MIKNKRDLMGAVSVARQLKRWVPSDSPDLINATSQYLAHEWLQNRMTPARTVYSVYTVARDLGASGDGEAAVIACALERLLEQQGCLEVSYS